MIRALPFVLALAAGLAACDKPRGEAAAPPPQEPTASSVAQFCGMSLAEHPGPKGQIFVRDQPAPLWFASARDAIAFLRLPETPKAVLAVYVNDMGRARDWAQPEPGAWVEARRASFVIGSRRHGGMEAAEAVPFGDPAAARRFVAANGGRIVGLAGIPDDYVLHDEGHGS